MTTFPPACCGRPSSADAAPSADAVPTTAHRAAAAMRCGALHRLDRRTPSVRTSSNSRCLRPAGGTRQAGGGNGISSSSSSSSSAVRGLRGNTRVPVPLHRAMRAHDGGTFIVDVSHRAHAAPFHMGNIGVRAGGKPIPRTVHQTRFRLVARNGFPSLPPGLRLEFDDRDLWHATGLRSGARAGGSLRMQSATESSPRIRALAPPEVD